MQFHQFLLAVLQHDIVVTLHQVMAATGEAPAVRHRVRIKLAGQTHARCVGQVEGKAGVILATFALFLLCAQ